MATEYVMQRDLEAFRTEMRGEFAGLRGEFAELRGEFARVEGRLEGLEGRLEGRFSALDGRIDGMPARLWRVNVITVLALGGFVLAAAKIA